MVRWDVCTKRRCAAETKSDGKGDGATEALPLRKKGKRRCHFDGIQRAEAELCLIEGRIPLSKNINTDTVISLSRDGPE